MAKRKNKQTDSVGKLDDAGSIQTDSRVDAQLLSQDEPQGEKTPKNKGEGAAMANNETIEGGSGLIANNAETQRDGIEASNCLESPIESSGIDNASDENRASNDDQVSRILMSQNGETLSSQTRQIPDDGLIPSPLGHGRIAPPFAVGNRQSPGRPAAGLVIKEWFNIMASQKWSAARARVCYRDDDAPMSKRAAAKQWLDTLGIADLADLESIVTGEDSLKSAQRKGLPTKDIKKIKVRKRTDKDGAETVEREIELHPDKSGEALDRIADRTIGKPSQTSLVATVSLDPQARAAAAIEQARALLGLADGVVRTV